MSAHALHFPERPQILRWGFASLAIVLVHAAAVGALVLWYKHNPPEPPIVPAIMITFEPAAPQTAAHDDKPLAEQKVEEIKEPPPEPQVEEAKVAEPKIEQPKIEQPPEKVAPPPPQPKRIALPKPEPKPIERKPVERKHVEKQQLPPQEEHAKSATRETLRQASVAASNAYASLVYGHLQRFKSYPASANGATGHIVARFVLSRAGNVLSASIVRSSGNAALDAEALASLHRASPFPPFPEGKAGAQDTFTAPMHFGGNL
jgi:protein TonB